LSTIDFRGEINIREGLGVTPALGKRVMIDPSAVVMGDVALGDDVSVWPHAAMRGDVQLIRIGARMMAPITLGASHCTLAKT